MKKIIIPIFTILLFSCTPAKWDKEAATKWCMKDSKKMIDDGQVTQKMAEVICDCYAEKAAVKYKSEAEADHDKYNQMLIGKDCAEALKDTLIKLKNNN